MSFDMNPADDDPHGECRYEISNLLVRVAEIEHQLALSNERAKLWERLHDARTKTLRSVEAKVERIRNLRFDYDGFNASEIGLQIQAELKAAIADAAEDRSYADLTASGGIKDAP